MLFKKEASLQMPLSVKPSTQTAVTFPDDCIIPI